MKKVYFKIVQSVEEISRKISTQFKLIDLAEKETERLIKRNKWSEIEKQLQHVELKLEKLQEFNIQGKKFY